MKCFIKSFVLVWLVLLLLSGAYAMGVDSGMSVVSNIWKDSDELLFGMTANERDDM